MTQNDDRAIRNLIETWVKAGNNLNVILPLMDEDVVFLGAGRQPMRGRAAFAAASQGMQNENMRFEASSEIIELHVNGDWAYCWTQLNVTMMPEGRPPILRAGPTLTMLRRQTDGTWAIYRDANMLAVVNDPQN
jgi:uncharacterized protein (TIGR02246 family)